LRAREIASSAELAQQSQTVPLLVDAWSLKNAVHEARHNGVESRSPRRLGLAAARKHLVCRKTVFVVAVTRLVTVILPASQQKLPPRGLCLRNEMQDSIRRGSRPARGNILSVCEAPNR
jgi:hypothetical protein